MLDGIFSVLESIGSFFSGIIDAIMGFIDDLVQFAQTLGTAAGQISSILGGFPGYFLAGILTLVAIMVLLRVIGRD